MIDCGFTLRFKKCGNAAKTILVCKLAPGLPGQNIASSHLSASTIYCDPKASIARAKVKLSYDNQRKASPPFVNSLRLKWQIVEAQVAIEDTQNSHRFAILYSACEASCKSAISSMAPNAGTEKQHKEACRAGRVTLNSGMAIHRHNQHLL